MPSLRKASGIIFLQLEELLSSTVIHESIDVLSAEMQDLGILSVCLSHQREPAKEPNDLRLRNEDKR